MTLLSRLLGFARDLLLARLFGAGSGADAFFVAFKIPNFLRRLFAEGAFAQAFVPVFSEYQAKRSEDETRLLASHVAGNLVGVLFLITLLGVVAAPILIRVFAPGFDIEGERYRLAAEMLQITFPYILFISLTAFAGAILNSRSKFWVPAFTPVLLNLSLIGAAIWLAPELEKPITALAWGVFIAGVAQLLFQLPFLYKEKMLVMPRWNWKDSGVRKILALMGPAIFGVSVAQINLLFDTIIASFLVTGSVSWLYFSDRLLEFPLGMFGIALATVVLPTLSRIFSAEESENKTDEFAATLSWAIKLVIVIGVPASVGLVVLSGPMLTTLFQYQEFSQHDVLMSRISLMVYGAGLVGFIMIKVLAPAFYSRQNTKTPVRIAVIAMITNMVFNVVFVYLLLHFKIAGAHAGLAAATSLSAFLNAFMLWLALQKEGVSLEGSTLLIVTLRVLLATTAMGIGLWYLQGELTEWFGLTAWQRTVWLLSLIAAGIIAYASLLFIFGLRPRHLKVSQ